MIYDIYVYDMHVTSNYSKVFTYIFLFLESCFCKQDAILGSSFVLRFLKFSRKSGFFSLSFVFVRWHSLSPVVPRAVICHFVWFFNLVPSVSFCYKTKGKKSCYFLKIAMGTRLLVFIND